MKNISRLCLALCLSFAFGMTTLQASNTLPIPTPSTNPNTPSEARVQEITQRLEQIQGMDKSQLTSKERKALRKEVRHMKRELSGGVYISAGALVVILVLLILLT